MTVTWRKDYPKTTTMLKDLPTIHSDNFNIVSSAAELEHYSMLSANTLSGYHRSGKVGMVFEGTTAAITALSSPKDGALAYDTSLGVLKYYAIATSAWYVISEATWSRVRAYRATTDVNVVADAAAATLIFNAESYDTMGEYNIATGTFTALTSGYYLVNANVCLCAAGSQAITARWTPAASAYHEAWASVGVANNWNNIEESPASDADYNVTATDNAYDGFSGGAALTAIPANASDIEIHVKWRGAKAGCVCNATCFSQTCTCYTTCYGQGCVCYNTCYQVNICTCGNAGGACYTGDATKTCVCDTTCYSYTLCYTCYYTCYGQSCTCNTGYGYGTGCDCYLKAHGSSEVRIRSWLYSEGAASYGDPLIPESVWTNYDDVWYNDPATEQEWTAAGASAILGFGYQAEHISAATHSTSAFVSNCYLYAKWYPIRPTIKLHIYAGNPQVLIETSTTPIYESVGEATYQGASISSIVHLHTNDQLTIRYQKSVFADVISAGSVNTNLSIHRLAGPLG